MTAVEFAQLAYGPLLPIGPPNGIIAPNSGLKPENMGKSPAMLRNGFWMGYPWPKIIFSPSQIDAWGAGIGLLLGELVAIDIDVREERVSKLIRSIVVRHLGKCVAMRVGEAPKCAFICRSQGTALLRRQIHFTYEDKKHMVELLAEGQQIVLWGIHQRTGDPYTWPFGIPPVADLPYVDHVLIDAMFADIEQQLNGLNIITSPTGGGQITRREDVDQDWLIGPIDRVREAVEHCPNTRANYPSRQDAVRMCAMIKAATRNEPDAGFEIWMKWGMEYPDNTEDFCIGLWETVGSSFSVGAEALYREARKHGLSTAKYDFEPLEIEMPSSVIPLLSAGCTVKNSEIWLAENLVEKYGDDLRWVRDRKIWYVYRGDIWVADVSLIMNYSIEFCSGIAALVANDSQLKSAEIKARAIASAHTVKAVAQLSESMPKVQANVDTFDADKDLLGVPGGIVDLRTGAMLPLDRERYISRRTTVAPVKAAAPLWEAFLLEACGGNLTKVAYLKRMAGYCLTGRTEEHVFFLLWGSGGNGKSTFLNCLAAILGEYCATAAMDTFTAHKDAAHPAGIAALAGARVVQCQETRPGQTWDEGLVKQLTGGDAVTARFMFGNPFTFIPLFKLIFSGNHQPHISSVGPAMARRIHVVPFQCQPRVVNKLLGEQLRDEYPAILAWMIEGAREWYTEGLNPPQEVLMATEDYLESEDTMGRWLLESCETETQGRGRSVELYENWQDWCNRQGSNPGSNVVFAKKLKERGFQSQRYNSGFEWHGLVLKKAE